jgi:hydrogenase expression/formation protein HypE
MSSRGKERPEFMERVVYSNLGRKSNKVLVGPGPGLDNGVLSVGNGKVIIFTVDPVSAIPAFGMRLSAWLSVHLIASDYTASGNDPQFAIFSYNFPPAMGEQARELFIRSVGDECRRLGITIAAGHTGSYPGGGFTVVGAGTMFGFATKNGYVTPAMAKTGDVILMTKHAAIEAAGSLALSFPRYTAKGLGGELSKQAAALTRQCSTVKDARIARMIGLGVGVTSMHDATEGGVLGALDEMAVAAGKAFRVNADTILVSREARATCALFGLDPLRTMGEGALLLTCSPGVVQGLTKIMSEAGVPLTVIGSVAAGHGLYISRAGRGERKFRPGQDKYWSAYSEAISRGLK